MSGDEGVSTLVAPIALTTGGASLAATGAAGWWWLIVVGAAAIVLGAVLIRLARRGLWRGNIEDGTPVPIDVSDEARTGSTSRVIDGRVDGR